MDTTLLTTTVLSSLLIAIAVFFLISSGSFFGFAIFSFIGVSLLLLFLTKHRQTELVSLLESKLFLVTFSIIAAFSTYVLTMLEGEDSKKIKRATVHALLAFVIAILAHLKMVAAPFFVVWIMAYYLHTE